MLAILALASPRPVLRDEFSALLWSRRYRDQARASLRQCVHELQTLLVPICGPILQAERSHLLLRTELVWTDARAGVISTEPLLNDLVGLDPAFDAWLNEERKRMGRTVAAMAEASLPRPGDAGFDPAAAIAAAERLLAIDPTHEGGWRALIAAHNASGDRAAAQDTYRRCVATLAEHGEQAPSLEIQALGTRLRAAATPERAAQRRKGVRVGVRPFRTLGARVGGAAAEDPLALGLAEEITAALARFKWLFLVAGPALSDPALSDPALSGPAGEEPHQHPHALDFLLEGTVQRSEHRVRVMIRLTDLHGGPELAWAGRFDRENSDILALQDEIAAEAAARIDQELLIREGARAAARLPASASAYDLTLAAIPAIYRLEEAQFRAAGASLAKAVRADSDYAASHAWWACWHLFLVGQNWAEDSTVAMSHAGMLAERAIALDPTDARALTIAGHVRAFLYHRVNEALELHGRALSLNPNLPLAWALTGLAETYAGRHDRALERIHHARQLSPFDPHGYFFDMALMVAHLMRREFEQVVELAARSLGMNPALTSTYKAALAALGHLGRKEEAAAMRRKLLAAEPGFRIAGTVRRTPLQRPEDMELYATGLRLAGLPE